MEKKSFIESIFGKGAVICFTALLIIVFVQVFSRFLLPKTPVWTEEASRFLFILTVSFSAPIAMKRKEFVRVEILLGRLSEATRRKMDIGILIASFLFFMLIAFKGVQFAQVGRYQTSPTLYIPMIFPYMTMAFVSFFIGFFALAESISLIRQPKIKERPEE